MPRFDTPVRISFTHYRHTLADPDGLSVKAAVDTLVRSGILKDDSTKEVEEVSHRQVKIDKQEAERTVITVEAVEA